jgi:hypothetical protein
VPSYSGLRGFELTVTPRDKRLSLACPRAGVHVQLTTICDCRFSIGETKWGPRALRREAAAACEQALRYKPDFELAHNNLQYARKMARALAK